MKKFTKFMIWLFRILRPIFRILHPLCLVLIFCSINAYGADKTTRLNLDQPAYGDSNWHTPVNNNAASLDQAVGTQHGKLGYHKNISPDTDNTYDIGTKAKSFRNLYVDGIGYIGKISADSVVAISDDTGLLGQFGRGASDTDVTYLKMKDKNGTAVYLTLSGDASSAVVKTTAP